MSEQTLERRMSTASERMARRAMLKARLNARSPTADRRTSDAETTMTPNRPYKRPISPGPTFLDVEAAASPFTRHHDVGTQDTSFEQVVSNNASRHSSARRRSSLSLSPGLEELPPDASLSERAERRRRIAEKAEELLSKGVPQRESGRLSAAVSRSSSAYLDSSNPFGDSVSKLRRSSIQDGESSEESGRASAPLDDTYASFGYEKYEQGRYSPAEAAPITVAVRRLSTENIKVLTNGNTKATNNNNSNNSNSSGSSKGLRPRDPSAANRVITGNAAKECSPINNIQADENDEVEQSNKLIMDVDSPRAGRATQPFDGTSRSAKGDNNDENDISTAAVVAAASDIRLPSPSPHQNEDGVWVPERALSVASDVPDPQEKTASPDRTRDQLPEAPQEQQPSSPLAPALGIAPVVTTALTEYASTKEYGSMSATLPPEATEKKDAAAPPVPLQEQGAVVPIRVAKESPTTGEGPALPPGKGKQGKKGGNDKDAPLIGGDDNNDNESGSHSNKNRKGKKNNKRDIIVPGSEVKAQTGSEESQCCSCCKCCNCCRRCRTCEIM